LFGTEDHDSHQAQSAANVKGKIRAGLAKGFPVKRLYDESSTGVDPVGHLHIQPDFVIADIGCGTGGFVATLLSSELPFRKLYAVDIDRPSLDVLEFVLAEAGLPGTDKVEVVHSPRDDTTLADGVLDLALMVKTPLYLQGYSDPNGRWRVDPENVHPTMRALHRNLKQSGRLHVFQPVQPSEGPLPEKVFVASVVNSGFRALSVERVRMFVATEFYHGVFEKK
jgi:SAM-dependent methyltransferase